MALILKLVGCSFHLITNEDESIVILTVKFLIDDNIPWAANNDGHDNNDNHKISNSTLIHFAIVILLEGTSMYEIFRYIFINLVMHGLFYCMIKTMKTLQSNKLWLLRICPNLTLENILFSLDTIYKVLISFTCRNAAINYY